MYPSNPFDTFLHFSTKNFRNTQGDRDYGSSFLKHNFIKILDRVGF